MEARLTRNPAREIGYCLLSAWGWGKPPTAAVTIQRIEQHVALNALLASKISPEVTTRILRLHLHRTVVRKLTFRLGLHLPRLSAATTQSST